MLLTIVIFFIAIFTAFGMLIFRAWEIRTMRANISENHDNKIPDLTFRQLEKSMLYLTKHIVQSIVLVVVKYWFILTTKTKKKISDSWPKIHALIQKKPESPDVVNKKPSFFRKAILESEAKIKRIKEKVKKEHGEDEDKI
jgi:hypothetical protein